MQCADSRGHKRSTPPSTSLFVYSNSPLLHYRAEVANCSACVTTPGCGYCLSTLQCVEGSSTGPADGLPCPSWLTSSGECPVVPTCDEHLNCNACAGDFECAWCASKGLCMVMSEIFSTDCRGTVFDQPCPTSFVGENRYVLFFSFNCITEFSP